jgi:kinetochore protein Nuf2
MEERQKRNNELKDLLKEYKKAQEAVAEKLSRTKQEQEKLKELLLQKMNAKEVVQRDVQKLKPYTQQNHSAMEDALKTLGEKLQTEKTQIDTLDRRARALQTSTDSFTVVAADVTSCSRLLTDVQADLAKEEEELAKASRHRDALADRSNNVRDVERQEKLLQKQLGNINGRQDKLQKKASEEAERAQKRMEELKETHSRLAEERGEKGREMERRRVRIEQTEKKVSFSIFKADEMLMYNRRWQNSKTTSKTRYMPRTTSISRWKAISSSISQRWSRASETTLGVQRLDVCWVLLLGH